MYMVYHIMHWLFNFEGRGNTDLELNLTKSSVNRDP